MNGYILENLEVLQMTDPITGKTVWGCDQDWYATARFKQRAGCGPSTATNIMAYAAQVKEKKMLWQRETFVWEDYVNMMEKIWNYVTPGRMGLYSMKKMADGVAEYTETQGVHTRTNILDVSLFPRQKRDLVEIEAFILRNLRLGLPLAFINYSNGALEQEKLEPWHWVTLVGLVLSADGKSFATIIDNGEKKEIDLSLWYRTTRIGGGFVSFQFD